MSRQPQKLNRVVRIGTRGSPLALVQAGTVARLIKKRFPKIKIQTVIIKTTGDKFQKPLYQAGEKVSGIDSHCYSGKGFFVKEIEDALLSGKIDLAVHSLKDVPAKIPNQLTLCSFLRREDPRDVFISLKYKSINDLPFGAKIGTSSPRRVAQISIQRPDIRIVPIRGNVATRIKKLKVGLCDATILAAAGLKRLGLLHPRGVEMGYIVDDFVHAVGQGIVSIETRKNEGDLINIIRSSTNDPKSEKMAIAERAFLETITGDCHTPIAASAYLSRDGVQLKGFVSTPSGKKYIDSSLCGKDPYSVGKKLGRKFVRLGARELINLKNEKKTIISTGLNLFKYDGAKVIHLPLIEVKPPSDFYKALDGTIKSIQNFNWLVFTSKTGVKFFFNRLKKTRANLSKKTKIAVVGVSTAELVKSYGHRVNLLPSSDFSSEELTKLFSKINLKGKKILFPRAEDGLDTLPRYFRSRRASLTLVPAYKTVARKLRNGEFKKVVLSKRPDFILFQSPSAVKAFYDNVGRFKIPKDVKLMGLGKITQDAMKSIK